MNRFKLTSIAGGVMSVAAVPSAFAQAAGGGGGSNYASTALSSLAGLESVFGTVYAGTITIAGAIVLGMVAWKYMKKLGNKV